MGLKKLFIAPALAGIMLLAGCEEVGDTGNTGTIIPGQSDNASMSEEETAVTPEKITSEIMDEIEIPSAVSKNIDSLGLYYDIDTALISDMSLYICGSGAYPDELAVFKLNNASDADTVKASIQKRLDSQISLYKDYTPDEMYKLEDAVLKSKGDYVYLLVCENNSRADEIADGLIK